VYTSFDGNPSVYDRLVACIEVSDCIVIKSCAEMEGHYINYLSEQFGKPMFVAGPVVPEPPQGVLEERWATWLSSFPDNTVTFATFGSETFLPVSAATELLLGLEATGRRSWPCSTSPRVWTPRPSLRRVSCRGSRSG
jgi:flavonol-3-O-glucoside L-rhamnosyltransferase